MIRFCIVSTARSGTSYLSTSLNSCPSVLCHGEIFHPNVVEHIADEYIDGLGVESRERNPTEFVDRVYSVKPDAAAAGFKIFRGHNDVALRYILLNNDIRKIVLQRDNVLASYSSLMSAIKTGHWQDKLNKIPPASRDPVECARLEVLEPIDPRVTFEPKGFSLHWNWERETYKQYRESITAAGAEWLDIDYLTLTGGDFSAIEQFLDLPAGFPWESDIRKLNPRCMLERFFNPDDVIAFAREHRIEHWLHE